MAPLLRGHIASEGDGEDPEGDPPRPGMRRSNPCGNGLSIDGAPVRRQVGSKRALCKQKKGSPLLRGRIASKESGEDLEGDLPRPGMRRSNPCGNGGHAIDSAPVRRQVGSDHAPCKRKNGPAFAEPFCVKGKRRESGGRSPSPGYAQKQPLRQCRSCVDSARPPPGRKQTHPLQAEKRPRFCGAVLRQREAERIWRVISFARALDTSCSGVSPR